LLACAERHAHAFAVQGLPGLSPSEVAVRS
jgi:hypothetical protein